VAVARYRGVVEAARSFFFDTAAWSCCNLASQKVEVIF
jgi:hypothetical protein